MEIDVVVFKEVASCCFEAVHARMGKVVCYFKTPYCPENGDFDYNFLTICTKQISDVAFNAACIS